MTERSNDLFSLFPIPVITQGTRRRDHLIDPSSSPTPHSLLPIPFQRRVPQPHESRPGTVMVDILQKHGDRLAAQQRPTWTASALCRRRWAFRFVATARGL